MSAVAAPSRKKQKEPDHQVSYPGQKHQNKWLTYGLLAFLSVAWLFPLVYALAQSFRSYEYTQANGYLSLGGWTFDNYIDAWERGNMAQSFQNTLIITVPAVLLTHVLASMFAFVLSLSLIHISEPTRPPSTSRMPSSA